MVAFFYIKHLIKFTMILRLGKYRKKLDGRLLICFICLSCIFNTVSSQNQVSTPVKPLAAKASSQPDRILLTWQSNPATTQTVTWRTDNTVKAPQAEIAEADASPLFTQYATSHPAKTENLRINDGNSVRYHAVEFTQLKPATLYAYRVGDGSVWSEWFQFRTANTKPEPFSFIYLGDSQTQLHSLWSRCIRAAYAAAPQARFMLHAGDLVNSPEADAEWQEWFAAGSFIYATIPSLFTAGNHEYAKTAGLPHLTKFWRPQINMPDNGPGPNKEDLVYYTDYQDVRIISLNSYWGAASQVKWLEKALQTNTQKWTVILYHYPMYSDARGQFSVPLLKHWKPLFDKYHVDLVLQGHDHVYSRVRGLSDNKEKKYKANGPVYVVSISGPKMYQFGEGTWMDRAAENSQLFQIISVDQEKLTFKSHLVTGEVYDAFELHKKPDGTSDLIEITPDIKEERRFHNTLAPGNK